MCWWLGVQWAGMAPYAVPCNMCFIGDCAANMLTQLSAESVMTVCMTNMLTVLSQNGSLLAPIWQLPPNGLTAVVRSWRYCAASAVG